jgi:Toprim-like
LLIHVGEQIKRFDADIRSFQGAFKQTPKSLDALGANLPVNIPRQAIDDREPQYMFPFGFHKSLELYNLHRMIGRENTRRRVVVVEGFFDCLKVSAAGFPCVALMGRSMSEAQEEFLVRHFNVACILLDGDEAGQQGAADCLARLGRRMWAYAPGPSEGKQPDLMTVEEIQTLLKK